MEEQNIIHVIMRIFNGSDKHEWSAVRGSFGDKVFLDYSSLSGQAAAEISADKIIEAWSAFLPKFKFTLHLLSNFEVEISGNAASAYCKGMAIHHLPNVPEGDTWTVYGTYEFALVKTDINWKVVSMKYNLLYQEGNTKLPQIATG